MNEFNSEFCEVKYIEPDNVALITWKKFACIENYRQPVRFATELVRKYDCESLIIDARNGFEDDKRDVEWAILSFIPELSATSCKFVSFIMNTQNDVEIGEEMDFWTVEFGKHFAVTKSRDYESAVKSTKSHILMNVRYTVNDDLRTEFYNALLSEGIIKASKQESGNIRYDYFIPQDDENDICLLEMWTSSDAQIRHTKTEHFKRLGLLKEKYVKSVKISKYIAEKI